MGIGTHKLPPQRGFLPIWCFGGRKVRTLQHHMAVNSIIAQTKLENEYLNDKFSLKMWSPRIMTSIVVAAAQTGLIFNKNNAMAFIMPANNFSWNRSPRKKKSSPKKKRFNK